jgi:peptidoglycan/LPS O-acetylase OafA/YrhL
MLGMLLWPAIKSHTLNVSLQALILNLTFTFSFAPWTGVVWAGWTVGVEMMFYAVFPVLLLTIRTTKATAVLVVVSIIVTYAARATLNVHYASHVAEYGYNWAYFSFAANLCYFALGIYAFRVSLLVDKTSIFSRWLLPVFATVLLGSLLIAQADNIWKDEAILWGVGFACLCVWQSTLPSRWSANVVFEYLGERSFSVYLLHPIIIFLLRNQIQGIYRSMTPYLDAHAYFVCGLLLLIPLLAFSELSFRLIEVPAINFGKKIIRRIRERDNTSARPCRDDLEQERTSSE